MDFRLFLRLSWNILRFFPQLLELAADNLDEFPAFFQPEKAFFRWRPKQIGTIFTPKNCISAPRAAPEANKKRLKPIKTAQEVCQNGEK